MPNASSHGVPDAERPLGEVEFVNGASAMSASGGYGPTRVATAIVGHADLRLGEKVQDILERQIEPTGGRMRGVRWSIPYHTSEVGKHVSRFVEEGIPRDQTCGSPPSSEELAATWKPYLETCIDAFGTGRGMYESNFPVDKRSFDYTACWNAFKRISAGASASEKAALFHGTAARVYRIAGRTAE
jgi:hypothetical protein